MSENEEERPLNWYQALADDPEYYTNTKQGQEELAQMIRQESERLLEEIGKSFKRTKDIIWLSRYCPSCKYYQENGAHSNCMRWNARVVKPFYGRPIWEKVASKTGSDEKELVVSDIDWTKKWKEISDKVVEWAIEKVNGGFPYFCFSTK